VITKANQISLIFDDLTYPDPFDHSSELAKQFKKAFDLLLEGLKLDPCKSATPDWSPFSEFIKPGDYVVIKPNLVRHIHLGGGDIFSVIVHPSIIKLTLDYVYKALGVTGTVILGDASLQSADFEKISEYMQFNKLVSYYSKRGHTLVVKDFRREASLKDELGHHFGRKEINTSEEFIEINLEEESFFYEVNHKFNGFRVTDYDVSLMHKNHNLVDNKYLIHRDILRADVIINIPKFKTHKKAGCTGAMKNIVGINGQKGYLPHHTFGAFESGGDEYKRNNYLRRLKTLFQEKTYKVSYWELPFWITSKVQEFSRLSQKIINKIARLTGPMDSYREGNWYGNDTIWRTIADLNKIIYYCDIGGMLKKNQQRTVFTIVDAIMAGDREGPMMPRERELGLLGAGFSTFMVDYALVGLVGFDWHKLPFLKKTLDREIEMKITSNVSNLPNKAEVNLNGKKINNDELLEHYKKHLEPSSGWRGHIEV
jgi:uncharacterized protein (DUF362 family)